MFGQNVQVEIKEELHQIKGWTFPSSNRGSVNLATFCQNRGWVPFPVSALGIALICELWVRRLHRERGSRWHERARLTGSKIWIPTQATKASIGICSVVLVFLILWAGKLAIKRIKTSQPETFNSGAGPWEESLPFLIHCGATPRELIAWVTPADAAMVTWSMCVTFRIPKAMV